MKKQLLVDREHPALRETAKEISVSEIKSKKIQQILKKMKDALHAEDDGVAIAAPQIGESLRIFVVNGETLDLIKKSTPEMEKTPDQVFINPEILKFSKKKKKMEEGCLSLRWFYGFVLRSEKVTIRAYDERGKLFEKGASGLLAQIFQHEVDHLNGVLFLDKAENVVDIPPTENHEK